MSLVRGQMLGSWLRLPSPQPPDDFRVDQRRKYGLLVPLSGRQEGHQRPPAVFGPFRPGRSIRVAPARRFLRRKQRAQPLPLHTPTSSCRPTRKFLMGAGGQ